MVNKKITVIVNGRFHAFDYAAELHKQGLLEKLISTMPYSIAKKYGIPKNKYIGLPILEVLKRVYRTVLKKELPVTWYSKLFNKTVLRVVPKHSDAVISFAGYSLEIFESKKLKNVIKILDRGSTHTLTNIELNKKAAEYHNTSFTPHPDQFIERELKEYALSNYILTPSVFVLNSFLENGIPKQNLIYNPYAFSTKKFSANKNINFNNTETILFVGQISARKGVGVLINAFKKIKREFPNSKLNIVGALNGIKEDTLNSEGINYFGVLKGDKLKKEYENASIFCLPSFEDGFGLVLLEAKHFGLPIVATKNTGVLDLFDKNDENKKYEIFEVGNSEDLYQKLSSFIIKNNIKYTDKIQDKSWTDFNNQLLKNIKWH